MHRILFYLIALAYYVAFMQHSHNNRLPSDRLISIRINITISGTLKYRRRYKRFRCDPINISLIPATQTRESCYDD